ncbi:MAG: histidine kinase [Taibaiella sp.]|nr:histidine kinase [Taibaiella sp.]
MPVVLSLHVLCWLIFLSLPATFNPRRQGEGFLGIFRDLAETPRWTNALLLLLVFYFNYLYAIPRLYFRRRYKAFAVSAVCAFVVFVLLNYLQRPHFESGGPWFSPLGNSFNLFMFLIVYLASFILCLADLWRRIREERWKRKMAVVTQRLNPHILFNTLNSIYALSLVKSDFVPAAIVKLSQALRYTMEEEANMVPLKKEIEFLQNYVDLEKMRLSPDLVCIFSVDGEVPAIDFPRFLLVPLVEGALKAVLADENASQVSISIRFTGNELVMTVDGANASQVEAGAIFDIATLRAQLDLNYPANHHLDLSDNGHIFVVTLRIALS